MRTELGCLVEHADAHVAIVLRGELAQSDRGGQPRRAGADDDHVELHALPFHDLRLLSAHALPRHLKLHAPGARWQEMLPFAPAVT